MQTTEELTDVTLCVAVAERVMGWPHRDEEVSLPCYVESENSLHVIDSDGPHHRKHRNWNPLESMSDCWEVVNAVQAKGWDLSLSRYNGMWVAGFELCGVETEDVEDTPYKAILKAALAIVEGEQG
jgi:hypothetical protein